MLLTLCTDETVTAAVYSLDRILHQIFNHTMMRNSLTCKSRANVFMQKKFIVIKHDLENFASVRVT